MQTEKRPKAADPPLQAQQEKYISQFQLNYAGINFGIINERI